MSSLREWVKSNSPLYFQNLPKYLVHISYSVSKCQWMNIQLSQLCSNPSMVLLVFYEPSKLPSLSLFPSLTYSSTLALLDIHVILPISSTSYAFWSSGLCPFLWRACSSFSVLFPGKNQPVLSLIAHPTDIASWTQG